MGNNKVWQPTLADRVWQAKERLRLKTARTLLPSAVAPTGSISGLDPRTLSRWLDTSHWTGTPPVEVLKHFDGIFPKLLDGEVMVEGGSEARLKDFVDPSAHDTIQAAYEASIACIPYIFWQPVVRYNKDYASKHTYEVFKYATSGLKPGVSFQGIAIDVEQGGDTDTNAADKVLALWKLLNDDPELKDAHIPIYTSMHILNDFYPALRERIGVNENYDLWMAQWYSGKTLSGSWEEIDAYLNSMVMRPGVPGWATWRWVQVMGAVLPPGMKSSIGVSFFKGDRQRAYDFIGYKTNSTPPEPPPPPSEPGDYVTLAQYTADQQRIFARLQAVESQSHPGTHTHPLNCGLPEYPVQPTLTNGYQEGGKA